MAAPIAVINGICFVFPDVLIHITSIGDLPFPHPNIAELADASDASDTVKAGGLKVITEVSEIINNSGGEEGFGGGVISGTQNAGCTFPQASATVFANGNGIVRQFDITLQNDGNVSGSVLNGDPTVLVGG